ncbi:MAG: tetratricopeptide repeat protein [Nitrospirae bacterium]|nr:tetratricopeptide repeat protein [Nitrospirota bacterium]
MSKTKRNKERQRETEPHRLQPAAPQQNPEGRASRYGWLFPLLLAVIVNANVLLNGFAWDDKKFFVDQSNPARKIDGPTISPDVYYRPLIERSYRFDQEIWGLNPFGAHLPVYLAHVLTTVFIYLNILALLRLYRKDESIVLLAASLFAVHPIHAEAVAWISGRNDVYMALFMMVALYAYLRYRQGIASRIMLPLFALGCVLSLLSKETAIPFLMIFPVLDVLFHRSGVIPPMAGGGMKDPLIWIGGMALIAFILYRFSNVPMPSAHREGAASFGNEIMTLLIALGYYLKLLFIPYPLNLFVSELPKGDLQAAFYLALGIGGIAVLLWMLLRWSRTLFAVGAVWFVLGMAAPLVVPLAKVAVTPVAERYTYLASGGFLLLVSLGIFEGRRWIEARVAAPMNARWVVGGLLLIVGLFSCLTVERNGVWRDEVTLWKDTIRKSPKAVLPHNNLGVVYKDLGQSEPALREFQTAISLQANYFQAHYNLGIIYEKLGRIDEAIQEYQTTLKLRPDDGQAHNNLGIVYKDLGRLEEAEKEFQAAQRLQPDSPVAHYNRGTSLIEQRRSEEAIREFQTAVRLDPNYQNAHYNLGLAYADQGKIPEAIEEFQTVVRLKPDDAGAHAVLGDLYKDQGKLNEAIAEYQAALKLDPNPVEVHYSLGLVYGRAGKLEDAKKEYQQALQIKPDFIAARKALESIPR